MRHGTQLSFLPSQAGTSAAPKDCQAACNVWAPALCREVAFDTKILKALDKRQRLRGLQCAGVLPAIPSRR